MELSSMRLRMERTDQSPNPRAKNQTTKQLLMLRGSEFKPQTQTGAIRYKTKNELPPIQTEPSK